MLKIVVGVAGAAGWATGAMLMASTAVHPLSMEEKGLLSDVAILGNYEVKAAEFARQTLNAESVQMAAQTMLVDQARLAEQLRGEVAKRDPGYRWPTSIDDKHRALLRKLERADNLSAEFGRQMMIALVDCKFLYRRLLESGRTDSHMRRVFEAAMSAAEAHLQLAEGLAANSLGMTAR